jgi:uncharacterized membrane protein YdjX (TVP38/TMEM64 family)
MRLIYIFIGLAVLLALPFIIWGEAFDAVLKGEAGLTWLNEFGRRWAWIVGVGVLAADLVLPIPATTVLAGLGMIYGPFVGGLIGSAGSIIAGLIAYGLSRSMGRDAAVWLAGEEDLLKGERFFANAGGWAVALSRWMPLLPEVIACLAGLSRMPFARFCVALACGSVPMAFAYAILGHTHADRPGLALLLCAVVPPVLWLLVGRVMARWTRE